MPKDEGKKEIKSAVKNPKLIEQRRNQIFNAAVVLFKKKGYHVTGLRELSKKAGMSLGNLYNYINTKEDVLSIFNQKAALKVLKAIDEKVSTVSDPLEKLNEMIEIELLAINKYEDLIMLLYQEGHAMNKKAIHSLLSGEEKQLQRFQRVLKDGMAKGVFRPCNPIIMSNLIKIMVDSWVLKRWSLREKVSLKEMKKEIIDLVQFGIVK
jgi:AcrR family transcriptional regulator